MLRIQRDDRRGQVLRFRRPHVRLDTHTSIEDLRRDLAPESQYRDADHRHVPLIASGTATQVLGCGTSVGRLSKALFPT